MKSSPGRTCNPAVAYCPKTDTAVIYGSVSNNGESPCCVTEYSLDSTDSIVLNRCYLEVSNETRFFVSVYENIVSAVSSADNKCSVYDYLNPPKIITILGNVTVQEVVYGFEKETGILSKTPIPNMTCLFLCFWRVIMTLTFTIPVRTSTTMSTRMRL